MLLYPPEPVIGDNDGFTEDNDIFGLREFGVSLTNLVTSVDQPLVLTLDGPWGSGKSTFAKQWAGELRKRGLPVILFDAFANDHQEDAFIALSAEIVAQVKGQEDTKPLLDEFLARAKTAGTILTPVVANAVVRTLTAGLASGEELKAVIEAAKAVADDSNTPLELAIAERLQQAEEDRKSLDAFRNALKDLAAGLSQKTAKEGERNQQGPLVFIIDELDRCRPPFALNILERIKHLFSVEGVCFVLVTNFEQLEAVVRGTYGLESEARTYLDKFFHMRLSLPTRRDGLLSKDSRILFINHIWNDLGLRSKGGGYDEGTRDMLKELAQIHDLRLRQLTRVISHIAFVYAARSRSQMPIGPIMTVLAVMRLLRPDLYQLAIEGRLEWDKVRPFINPGSQTNPAVGEDVLNWWQYATAKELPEADWVKEIGVRASRRADSRHEIVPQIGALMEQFQYSSL